MLLESLSHQIACAAIGGMAAELFHWYSLAKKHESLQKFRKNIVYWMTTLGMILLGGILPILYLDGPAQALLCFHLGAATPVLIEKLISKVPDVAVAQGNASSSFKEFMDW